MNFFYAATAIDSSEPDELNAFFISTGISLSAMEWKDRTPAERLAMLDLANSLHWEELEHYHEGKPAPRIERFRAALRPAGEEYEGQHEAFNQELKQALEIWMESKETPVLAGDC